jgi:hypothetical protein
VRTRSSAIAACLSEVVRLSKKNAGIDLADQQVCDVGRSGPGPAHWKPSDHGATAESEVGIAPSLQIEAQRRKYLFMTSDLRQGTGATVFSESDVAKGRHGNGLSRGATWPEGLPTLPPWSKLSWSLFLPLVFAGNVVVAILAWFIVELVMR